MQWLAISKRIDRFNEVIGKISAHCTILVVLLTFLVTILRYVFNVGFIALQESVLYFHSIVFLLAAAHTLRQGYHVRIDLLHAGRPDRKKAIMEIFGTLFFLLPSMIFTLAFSWDYVAISWSYFEGSQEAGGLDFVYILKSLLIIMPLLLILQGVADLIRNILFVKGLIGVEDWNNH